MKRICAYIVFAALSFVFPVLSGAVPTNGAAAAARYNEAGALYRDGHFREALEVYETLIASGIRNPDLYYNAANAAYRSEMLGKSVLYFERALKLAPSDREAFANLVFVNSRKQDKEPSDENAALAFLERWYASINTDSAALWSGIAFAFMMLLAVFMLFLSGWKRVLPGIAAGLCGLVFLSSTGMLIQKIHRNAVTREAVIMVPEAHAYSGPGIENTLIFTLHEGTKVFLERNQDAWMLVRLKSGAGGWIEESSVEKI